MIWANDSLFREKVFSEKKSPNVLKIISQTPIEGIWASDSLFREKKVFSQKSLQMS